MEKHQDQSGKSIRKGCREILLKNGKLVYNKIRLRGRLKE